jgi:hypothetical protein
MNNPVNYTDPSGYLFGIDDFALACIAAKFVFSSAMSYSSGQSLWKSFSSSAMQMGIDIAVAAGTAGIGNIMGHGVGTFGNELARAGLHGMLQGTGSALMGGDYLQGFTAGTFASLTGSGAQAIGLGFTGILGGTTLAGGFSSYIAGGNIIDGAFIGFNIGLHNHLGKSSQDDSEVAYTINLEEIDVYGTKTIITPKSHIPIEKPLQPVYPEFDLILGMKSILNFGLKVTSPNNFKHHNSPSNFFENTYYSNKVKDQMNIGDYHSFPNSVEAFENDGIKVPLKGGDGILRQKLKIPGWYKGKYGYFEFIREPNGKINHRLFKPYK